MFDWLSGLLGGLGGAGEAASSAADVAGTASSFYPTELMGAIGDVAGGVGNFVGQNWQGLGQLGLGATNALMPMMMQQGQGQQMPPQMGMGMPPANLMPQLSGSTPDQAAGMLRRTRGDMQSSGLAGASPDFLAMQAGLTPEELQQLMGQYGGR